MLLAGSAATVSGWALLAPRSFYAGFPGLGHHWVVVDGPYNEHLVRDVGALYLGLLVLTLAAVARPAPALARLAGAVWLVFGVPHLAYHATHLQGLRIADRWLNLLTLGGAVLLAAVLVVAPPRRVADGGR